MCNVEGYEIHVKVLDSSLLVGKFNFIVSFKTLITDKLEVVLMVFLI